jgi:hypothetical protein
MNKPSSWLLLAGLFCDLSVAVKMEATYSSETSVEFQWTTQHYIPESLAAHGH